MRSISWYVDKFRWQDISGSVINELLEAVFAPLTLFNLGTLHTLIPSSLLDNCRVLQQHTNRPRYLSTKCHAWDAALVVAGLCEVACWLVLLIPAAILFGTLPLFEAGMRKTSHV